MSQTSESIAEPSDAAKLRELAAALRDVPIMFGSLRETADRLERFEKFAETVANVLYEIGIRDDGHGELVAILRNARELRDRR